MQSLVTIALVCLGTAIRAQDTTASATTDPSSHTVRDFRIDGVRLQYLDWGGSGPLLVLLHGWNSTAHIFDDLAPRFADRFHVIALTQRGFGESESPNGGYSLARYADDVAGLIRHLGADRAHVAGHSFGGWVVTRLASAHPDRVGRAVYLDAAYSLAGADSVIGKRPFERPSTAGIKNNAEYFEWLRKYFYGTWSPALEADAAINAVHWDHRVAQPALDEARNAPQQWELIGVPALAICSIAQVESEFPWINRTSAEYAIAKRYVDTVRRPFQRTECARFARSVRHSQVLELEGGHFIFTTRAEDVADSMRRFLLAPP
jgi:pimeloyl-ACP methyl ester carboxylesterase